MTQTRYDVFALAVADRCCFAIALWSLSFTCDHQYCPTLFLFSFYSFIHPEEHSQRRFSSYIFLTTIFCSSLRVFFFLSSDSFLTHKKMVIHNMYTITLYKSRQGQNKRKRTKKSTVQCVHIHTDALRTQQITALKKKTQAPCCLYCRIFFSLWTFERNNKFSFSLFPSIVTLRRFNQHTHNYRPLMLGVLKHAINSYCIF